MLCSVGGDIKFMVNKILKIREKAGIKLLD